MSLKVISFKNGRIAPDWNPASFEIHDEYYVLEGAHAIIADQCITCHNGDYNNTPNTCVILVGLRRSMTCRAGKDGVVVRVGMTVCTLIPRAFMCTAVDREKLLVMITVFCR